MKKNKPKANRRKRPLANRGDGITRGRQIVTNYQQVRRGGKLLFEFDATNDRIRIVKRGQTSVIDLKTLRGR